MRGNYEPHMLKKIENLDAVCKFQDKRNLPNPKEKI